MLHVATILNYLMGSLRKASTTGGPSKLDVFYVSSNQQKPQEGSSRDPNIRDPVQLFAQYERPPPIHCF